MTALIIEGLTAALRPLATDLLARAAVEGLQTLLARDAGRRSAAEQMVNFSKGRHHDESGRWLLNDPVRHTGVVTNALPASSPHCHAAALDVMLLENGRVLGLGPDLAPAERARQLALYCRLGRIGEELGLVWGGLFASIHDYDHFELKSWRDLPLV